MQSPSFEPSREQKAFLAVVCLLLLSLSPMLMINPNYDRKLDDFENDSSFTGTVEPWIDGGQPWPQPGRLSQRSSEGPLHSPTGGAGTDSPNNATELSSIVDPVINWEYGTYSIGTDALGTPVGDFSQQIVTDEAAIERCGGDSLFIVLIQTEVVGGNDHSVVKIIEGEDADLAWEVDLGATEIIKASPVIVDLDDDGMQEVIIVYDAGSALYVDAYSPRLHCSVTGWSPGGSKSGELLWSYTDDNLQIGSTNGPYTSSWLGGLRPTTQPLLADLDLDGDAELVLAVIDDNENPVVLALPLVANGVPTPIWQSTLEDGSHPSDPSFAQVDDQTAYVLLTTTEASSGAMWVWKLNSVSGDQLWSLSSVSYTHLTLPTTPYV